MNTANSTNIDTNLTAAHATNFKQEVSVASFSNFLDEMSNPTGTNSGDEYYWQHQEHLQQSALQFNARKVQISKKQEVNDITADQSTQEGVPEDLLIKINSAEPRLINTHLIQNISPEQQAIDEEQVGLLKVKQIFIDNTILMTSSKETSTPVTKIESKESVSQPIPLTKKHHLFIEADQAELSLNLHELDKREQAILTHEIKKSLEQQGIHLKQLIINGEIR